MDSDELSDIAKLQAVLREAHSSDQTLDFHPLDEQINKVKRTQETCNSALASLEHVHFKFLKALNEIRNQRSVVMDKINALRSTNSTETSSKTPRVLSNPCGPFFTDIQLYQPPDNRDAVKIKQLGLINMMRPPLGRLWNSVDKNIVIEAIRKQTIKTRTHLAKSKLRALERDSSSSLSDLNKARTAVDRFNNISTETIVEPLDDSNSYDWDIVSTALQGRHSAFECHNMWNLLLHPQINKSPWTASETHKLRLVASYHNYCDWEDIAADLNTGRSAYQCFVYYKMNVRRNDSIGKRWTPAEDAHLFSVIEHCRVGNHIPWSKVSFFLHNRSSTQIYSRWIQRRHNYKKEILSPEEIAVLKAAFAVYGTQFKRITKLLPGRNKNNVIQCYYSLFGAKRHSGKDWSTDEDTILLKIADDRKPHVDFEDIHKMLPKKTLEGIKSRYNHLLLEYLGKKGKTNTTTFRLPESPAPKALSELEKTLKNLAESRKPSDKIKYIKSEHDKEIETDALDQKIIRFFAEDRAPKATQNPIPYVNSTALKSILFLLGSNLNFTSLEHDRFLESNYNLKKALEESLQVNKEKKAVQLSGIRTYSRKKVVQEKPTLLENTVLTGIWSHESSKNTNIQNYFPPMLDTITAIRTMSLLKHHQSYNVHKRSLNEYFLKPSDMDKQLTLFISRFNVLFRWPLLLSFVETNQHLLSSIDDQNKLLPIDDINCISYDEDEDNEDTIKLHDDDSNDKAHCSNVHKMCYKINRKRKSDTNHHEQNKKVSKNEL